MHKIIIKEADEQFILKVYTVLVLKLSAKNRCDYTTPLCFPIAL